MTNKEFVVAYYCEEELNMIEVHNLY
jgi:hypothetical protein